MDSLLNNRRNDIQTVLKSGFPILELKLTDPKLHLAQALAISNFQFIVNCKTPMGESLLNEIFAVYPARQSELPAGIDQNGNIYRVEMYNYGYNLSSICLVDIGENKVLKVNTIPNSQPDIPEHLKILALEIACNSAEVLKELSYKPENSEALMASTKTALNRTKCERSLHLCVAPTFVKDNKALWAIVDLTDLKLVGTRWTNVGHSEGISERRIQNAKIMECYCLKDSLYKDENWRFKFTLTSSDGLRISEVYYKNNLVINSMKLVDWHVSYSNSDGFGYSDAIGCPMFSQSAVVAIDPPRKIDIVENGKKIGIAIEQNYFSEGWPAPCNYNYLQRFEFYNNGRFRPAFGSLGRGCGNDGTYRPVSRIAFAGEQNSFAEWDINKWKTWQKENWRLQDILSTYTPEGFQYKIYDPKDNGYYIEANRGQFHDGGRGDNAYTYVTVHHVDKDEGDTDLITIGPCCNTDFHQGPDKFIYPDQENINNTGLVIWYVPQLKNDDTSGKEYCWAQSYYESGVIKSKIFPCMSGPMFVPIIQNH
ncbi:MAG TPA: hypothetical protein VK590_12885 [Saprospiraceae bacterium]|nr:hypothetical protein [Saprospiraceae bacterium]